MAASHSHHSQALCLTSTLYRRSDRMLVQVYGVAFAKAIAAGGEEKAALAEATALAFCKGGSSATAFAKAYSVALERNRNG